MKNPIKLLIFTICYLLFALPIMAVSPTPEATTTANPEIKKNLEENFQGVVNSLTKEKRAYVGEITDINTTLELKTIDGNKQVKIDNATFIGMKGNEIKLENLEIGQFVISIGYLEDNGVLDGRRIVVIAKPKTSTRQVVFGKVTDMSSDGEKILTIKHPKTETIYEVEVSDQTTITKVNQEENNDIAFEEIKTGNYVVIIAVSKEEGQPLTANSIYLISSWSAENQEGSSSEAAESATESAEKKPTATPTKTTTTSPTPTPTE